MGLGAHVRARPVVDHVAVEPAAAARLENLYVAAAASRAEGAGRKVGLGAVGAALQPKLARPAAIPEVLGLRRGLRENTVHEGVDPVVASRPPFLIKPRALVEAVRRPGHD